MATKKTKTSTFGVGKREGHDASDFYNRTMYQGLPAGSDQVGEIEMPALGDWADRIYNLSSEKMPIPDNSVGLAFTSPPYNSGKDYDLDLTLEEYFALMQRVGEEVYRVLRPGGRYLINVANLGRKPYI